MKPLISILLIMVIYKTANAQEPDINSYYWIKIAQGQILDGDTLLALKSLEIAANYGLFDKSAITDNKYLSYLQNEPSGSNIFESIAANQRDLEDPENLTVETGDIARFWIAFDHIDEENAADIFRDKYILSGSKGLQTFYQIRMNNSIEKPIKRIKALKSYYSSIRSATENMVNIRPEILRAAKMLKEIYSPAYFPPIYFLMGSLTNVGTPDGYGGMLIGSEHLCLYEGVDTTDLSALDRMVIFNLDHAVPIILHEYVHLQQKNKVEKTLLEFAISEGAADFITYLLLGKYTDPKLYAFGAEHEEKLWFEFNSQMLEEDIDDWIFNSYNAETGYPGNLGYYMGFKICEHYYANAEDKKQAVKEILEIDDFEKFLFKSRYQDIHLSLNWVEEK